MADKGVKKQTKVGRFIKNVAPELLDIAGDLTGIDALDRIGNLIRGKQDMDPQDKEIALALIEKDREEMRLHSETERERIRAEIEKENNVTGRWNADMQSDSWLSKNIRPLTLAFSLLTVFAMGIVDSINTVKFDVPEMWVYLLGSVLITALAGYFGLRTYDKHIAAKK